jgi:predicted RNase H-like HicB family nuclease
MKLKVIIHEAEEGGYWAEVPALPGCFSQGETLDEIMENIREAAEGWLLASEDIKTTGNDRIAEVVI